MEENKKPEERKKLYEENPDDFIHVSELVVAVKNTPKGFAYLVNPDKNNLGAGRRELHIAMGELSYRVANYLVRMDMETQLKKKSSIIKPGNNGGGLGFLRKKLRRK